MHCQIFTSSRNVEECIHCGSASQIANRLLNTPSGRPVLSQKSRSLVEGPLLSDHKGTFPNPELRQHWSVLPQTYKKLRGF
jgi:hypothetical protein